MIVDFIFKFVTGDLYPVSVNHHHKITAVHIRSKLGLVLATEKDGYFCCQPAQNLAVSIDQPPFLLDLVFFG